MNKREYGIIKKSIRAYMEGLDLDEIKAEMLQGGLLTTNTKLAKGDNLNYGLELLPSVLSPLNTCEGAGVCKYTCLAFSGIGNLFKSKMLLNGKGLSAPLKKKARRTFLLINDREWFERLLIADIQNKYNMSILGGKPCYIRLNVTSDLDWSHITGKLPHIKFYDYTKVWSRLSTNNYLFTYSASELTDNFMIMEKLESGENVAIVFHGTKLPESYFGFKIIDGDKNDDRSEDERGVIVGLLVKTTVGGQDLDSTFFFNP